MRRIRGIVGIVTAVVALTGLSLPAWAAEPVVIKYSNWLPATHPLMKEVFGPWAAEVDKATQGRVRVEFLPKMVGTVPAQYDAVLDGLADMAMVVPGYTPGRFPLIELGELPLIVDDSRIGAAAFYRFYLRHLASRNVFKGVHVLSTMTSSASHIFTTKRPINRLADLRGLKLRSPIASSTATIEVLGAVPVSKPVSELYELLSNGVLDGSLSGKEQANTFKLSEVTRHLTVIPGGIANSVLAVVMNEAKWKAIAPADQQAIMKLSGEAMADAVGRTFHASEEEGVTKMLKAGAKVTMANPELMEEMKAALVPLEQQALAKAGKAGLPDPTAALADYRADVERARKKTVRSQ